MGEPPEEHAPPKPTQGDYPRWLIGKCSKTDVNSAQKRLETVSPKLLSDIKASEFWQRLMISLSEVEDRYTSSCGYKLFARSERPGMVAKPYSSLLDKSYRKNILLNSDWPEPPEDGWITPVNWYGRINDIARTTVVVKYLDGVHVFAEHTRRLAHEFGHEFDVDYEARPEGYYAAHCYVSFNVDIPTLSWETEIVAARLEIQVTTQLQDVIRSLTHDYYERRRSNIPTSDVKWQWDYTCPEFVPNYLGHILHYVEGMIMDVRSRGSGK